MPQLHIFLKERDFAVYLSLPTESQGRLRKKIQKIILQELNILPRNGEK